MYSFNFPNMLNSITSNLVSDKEAIRLHLELLFGSEKTSLFGDPYYGCNLIQAYFEQQNSIIADLLIDEIHTSISNFIPQLYVERKNIKIKCVKTALYAEINATNRLDNTNDLYVIRLNDETYN